jgi:hypothetical protein
MAITARYSCDECGYSSTSRQAAERHSCDVQQNGGLCEDFPCCGHRRGECQERAEFTSEYWLEMSERFEDPADYDAFCDMMDRQEQGY